MVLGSYGWSLDYRERHPETQRLGDLGPGSRSRQGLRSRASEYAQRSDLGGCRCLSVAGIRSSRFDCGCCHSLSLVEGVLTWPLHSGRSQKFQATSPSPGEPLGHPGSCMGNLGQSGRNLGKLRKAEVRRKLWRVHKGTVEAKTVSSAL